MDKNAAALAKYSPSQMKAILLYHMIPQVVYSTQMNSGDLPTLLKGNTIPVRSSSAGADVGPPGGDTGRFDLADNFMTSGPTHRLAFLMIPPTMPAAADVVTASDVPVGSIAQATNEYWNSWDDSNQFKYKF